MSKKSKLSPKDAEKLRRREIAREKRRTSPAPPEVPLRDTGGS